jgi:hypothetical protein
MNSNSKSLLTPVGRLVQGSLYEPQTTDPEGRQLVVKQGPNAGKPRVDYYFGLAIAKGKEKHWSETIWGQIIWNVGHAAFPNGHADLPTFAWKIQDGDSTVLNKVGRRNCDREGYPGHWVLNFTSGFAPGIYNEDGTKTITEKDFINLGDYIQVYGNVNDNESTQQPGVFLNHSMVAFSRYGNRIILGPDPKLVGFGKSPIPEGALSVPPDGRFNPASVPLIPALPNNLTPLNIPNVPVPQANHNTPVQPSNVPVPHINILNPPMPKHRIMTAEAKGHSYEEWAAAGWSDEQLIQHGMMLA